ncbi:hypothetical protein J6590_071684 [Homalodisca vitripennis]|nr:hypothetical protein J6590_071684 [Homalodisca vitripennis]
MRIIRAARVDGSYCRGYGVSGEVTGHDNKQRPLLLFRHGVEFTTVKYRIGNALVFSKRAAVPFWPTDQCWLTSCSSPPFPRTKLIPLTVWYSVLRSVQSFSPCGTVCYDEYIASHRAVQCATLSTELLTYLVLPFCPTDQFTPLSSIANATHLVQRNQSSNLGFPRTKRHRSPCGTECYAEYRASHRAVQCATMSTELLTHET